MNIQAMMQQAKKMQKEIENKQNEINNTEYEGVSEWCRVSLKGDYTLKNIKINNEVVNIEDIETLEDMVLLAYNDAKKKLELDVENKMGQYKNLGGLM